MSVSARRPLTIRSILVGNGLADTFNSIANDSKHLTPLIARWEIFVSGRGHLPLFVKHGRGARELESHSLGPRPDHWSCEAKATPASARQLCRRNRRLLAITRDLGARHRAVGRHRS